MDNFKVYEDWSDAIVIFLFDGGEVKQAFEGWECGMKGCILDAIGELAEDPDAWKGWINDLMDVFTDKTIKEVYDSYDKHENLIAEGRFGEVTICLEKMGEAGRFVFGLE